MSKRWSLEGLLAQAREEEKKYDWPAAANFHKEALRRAIESEDFLRAGEIQERIGYYLYRGAFQAETLEEFKRRMQEAVEAHEKAHRFYRKLADEHKAKMFRCESVTKYLDYWLTSDTSEKKRLLDECLELEGNALAVFLKIGDMLEYGRTYNELPHVFWLRVTLEWNRQTSKSIIEKGMKWGEKAVAALSKLGNSWELARAYFTLATCLSMASEILIADPEKQEQHRQKMFKYLSEAVDLSEEVGAAHLSGLSHYRIGVWDIEQKKAIRHFEKTLERGKRTRDNFLIALGLDGLAYTTYWKACVTEYPETQRELVEKAMRFYDKSQHYYSKISFIGPTNDAIAWPAGYSVYYLHLSKLETDLGKRLEFLKKSEKIGMEGLKLAKDSGMPEVISGVHHVLSATLEARARIESDPSEKRSRLEKALIYREKAIEFLEQLWPFDYWGRGVNQNYLAEIKEQLAGIEPDLAGKRNLLDEAVLCKEKCLKLCSKDLLYFIRVGNMMPFAAFQRYQNSYAKLLTLLYDLTHKAEHLRKAINILQKSIESARKVDLVSRIAESYWKMAKAQDTLEQHLEASKSFERASESYMLVAKKIPQIKGFYSEYASYMQAWAELEKSRQEHENENYVQSREHYRMCSRYLEMTKKWFYLSSYYFAWSLLEHGEELSRLDKPQDAMKAFDEAGRAFRDSVNSLRKKAGKLEDSEERNEASKLAIIARLRKQYCMGRVLMEEAKLSSKRGDKVSGAKKYASAARLFEGIAPDFEREEARTELEFAATLCQAWEKMELAEERREPALFRKAAELFAKAGEITHKKRAGLIAVGNSCFCEALELGTKFMTTSSMDFYSGAKLRMENAAGYYQRAGFEKAALWVEATKRLFDAHVYAGKAEAEVEPEKRVRSYLVAEKCLELSANLYGKAGYSDRRNEALQSLERVTKERKVALSLSEILTAPTILSSTTGVSMPDSTEKAAGLNEFESVSISARLSVPDEFIPGEEFQVKLDLVNVGKKPGLLVRVEGLVPRKCKVVKVPSHCALEDDSLNMGGRRLDPLSVESISILVQVGGLIGVSLSPRVVYVDDLGNFKTARVERVKILPVVEFESGVAQVVFNYLVDAFVEDSVRLRLSVEKSGWRSFPQIIKGAGVSKRSLYGAGGRLGSGLSELRRKGLVDLKTFRGERGRGGHILRVRIHHEKELVRRYVKENAPDFSV